MGVETLNESQIADLLERFPAEAYSFVDQGLTATARKLHGNIRVTEASHHISGQDLCRGLREFAWERWGFMARTVLGQWGIHCTMDFGKIVYAMIEYGMMQKTDEDSLEDFRDVFDFQTGLESEYQILLMEAESKS